MIAIIICLVGYLMDLTQANTLDGYQLRIRLKHISPIIWRRIIISDAISIKDLHYTLQIVMGWSDIHLNSFTIHGKNYGVAHIGGMSFSDNPADVAFHQLGLRQNEKFIYEYNFNCFWEHDIRVASRLYRRQSCCAT